MNTLSRGKGLLTRTQITYWLTVLDTTLYRRLDIDVSHSQLYISAIKLEKAYYFKVCMSSLQWHFASIFLHLQRYMVSAAAPGTVVLNVYGLHFFGEAWNDPISRLQKYMVSVMKFLDGILLKHKSVYWITEHYPHISLAFNFYWFYKVCILDTNYEKHRHFTVYMEYCSGDFCTGTKANQWIFSLHLAWSLSQDAIVLVVASL